MIAISDFVMTEERQKMRINSPSVVQSFRLSDDFVASSHGIVALDHCSDVLIFGGKCHPVITLPGQSHFDKTMLCESFLMFI